MAATKGCTAAQLAVAWLVTRGDDILPLAGVRNRARLADNLAALDIAVAPEEAAALDRAFAAGAIRGDRYPSFVLKYAAH